MKLSREQVLGIARHTLTFIGGAIVAKGYATESEVIEISGGILTLIGSIWSIVEKNKK